MKSRLPIILFVAVLIVSLVFTGYLVRSVSTNLRALSVAQHDDVGWNLSQLEVEVLQLQRITDDVVRNPEVSLSGFLRRYDIFYSRVEVLSTEPRQDIFVSDAKARAAIAAFDDFLTRTTPIVDGPQDALRAELPKILSEIESLRAEARSIALAGIQTFARQDSQRREDLSQTLIKLAIAVMGLVLILTFAILVLERLFRESRVVMLENQRVRSRFEAAISSTLDAVLVVDTSGKIIEYNGAAATVFGYDREEALGHDMAELIVPEHMREMHNKGMKRFLETGEKRVIDAGRVRLEAQRKSGEMFPVELSISLAETDGEKVFVSFLRDITDEIKAVDDLRNARDKARQGEKAKADLLTVMSHEMRTPLNGILGSLSLIDQTNMADRQREHLKSIAVSGQLLLSHVNDVLDLSSLSSDAKLKEKARFDLQDVLQTVSDSLRSSAETRGNTLTFDVLTNGLRAVEGFKTELQQCLINLVGNAIKFTFDGQISVEVERLSSDDLVEIRVADTGAGIDEKDLETIFDEFVTIDAAFDRENTGTGLGLAITRRLAESMGGSVDAESELGEGSLFTLRLPLPDAPLSKVDSSESDVVDHFAMPVDTHALVVDDNDINRMVMIDTLEQLGLAATEATDGYDALNQLEQRSFDIVLLDISMPGIDGIETLNRIRKLKSPSKHVPAIAVTAHAAKKDHERILEAPFADLIVKPYQSSVLQRKIASVLAGGHCSSTEIETSEKQPDFRSRFGEEKYQRALDSFRAELEAVSHAIVDAPQPTADVQQVAHKVAGTAAVLEEKEMWSLLIALEQASDQNWEETKEAFLNALPVEETS